ncbi:MAG: Txe/YoeB family addiction module toxin [Spirochaetales bacterium]|nr:Txe/YoeB family addiction module toxin [Spirochaetales bacterium]
MRLVFAEHAWEDYLYWQQNDKKIVKRINLLIKEIKRNPNKGIVEPEKLKNTFSGYSSRRITDEHRIVYRVMNDTLTIVQLRYHY